MNGGGKKGKKAYDKDSEENVPTEHERNCPQDDEKKRPRNRKDSVKDTYRNNRNSNVQDVPNSIQVSGLRNTDKGGNRDPATETERPF
jgi:hypothetical protein